MQTCSGCLIFTAMKTLSLQIVRRVGQIHQHFHSSTYNTLVFYGGRSFMASAGSSSLFAAFIIGVCGGHFEGLENRP